MNLYSISVFVYKECAFFIYREDVFKEFSKGIVDLVLFSQQLDFMLG